MKFTALQECLLWIVAASILGFGISALFSGWLKLSRNIFLVPYIILTSLFLLTYLLWNEGVVTGEFWIKNWQWGILALIAGGTLLVKNIQAQPRSRQKHGRRLWWEILWAGAAYGILDGLYLNVFPVIAVQDIFSSVAAQGGLRVDILTGVTALAASLVITLFYHIGYPEFRNKSIRLVLLGNTIITLTFLLSGNPMAALLCHAIMHIAAVIRGPETTLQLPPHYTTGFQSEK